MVCLEITPKHTFSISLLETLIKSEGLKYDHVYPYLFATLLKNKVTIEPNK